MLRLLIAAVQHEDTLKAASHASAPAATYRGNGMRTFGLALAVRGLPKGSPPATRRSTKLSALKQTGAILDDGRVPYH
jgi:hypothetical protein